MQTDLATKQEVRDIIQQETAGLEQRLSRLISQIGKPRRMTLQECADEWGITKPYASKRLKKMYRDNEINTVDFDSRPITVNRKDFFANFRGQQ